VTVPVDRRPPGAHCVEHLDGLTVVNQRQPGAAGTDRDPANIAPTVLYLLGAESRGINGQVYLVQGYEIKRLGDVGWDKEMTNDGPWEIATIAQRLPWELGPKTTPTPVPWPERPGR